MAGNLQGRTGCVTLGHVVAGNLQGRTGCVTLGHVMAGNLQARKDWVCDIGTCDGW